jgi:hypothetical protein
VDRAGFTYWLQGDVRGTGPRLYQAAPPVYHMAHSEHERGRSLVDDCQLSATQPINSGCGKDRGGGKGDESGAASRRCVLPPYYDPAMSEEAMDVPCMHCGATDGDDSFVLCDGCPNGGHLMCLGMTGVPTDDWHCVVCVRGAGFFHLPSPRAGTWKVLGTSPQEMLKAATALTCGGDKEAGRAIAAAAECLVDELDREAKRKVNPQHINWEGSVNHCSLHCRSAKFRGLV